jgi:YVTN family beta-propeller protein
MKHHKSIFFHHLKALLSKEQRTETAVGHTYGKDESSFVEMVNEELKHKGVPVEKRFNGKYQKDLKRFGTPMGIIDVAEDSLPRNKAVQDSSKHVPTSNEQKAKDLKRYGTPEGIIDVAASEPERKYREKTKACFPSNRRFKGDYASDFKRFGTSQGIINVSNDEAISETSCTKEFSEKIYKQIKDRYKGRDINPASPNLYADIYKDFSKAQVTIRNNTPRDKEITLWGAKPEVFSGEINYEAVEEQVVLGQIPSPVHPQGLVYNPVNKLMYAANQLSGTVTVINNNEVLTTIQLQPSFPGLCSPVAAAVNSSPKSAHYGFVYVVCSVSNTVQVISPLHEVVASIQVGTRPIAIAHNPVNNQVYVANLVDNTVSVIDSETNSLVAALVTETGPIGLGVNPENGQMYICNSVSNSIVIYSGSHVLLATISNTGQRPVSVNYNPANGFMYAAASDSNEILKINPVTHVISKRIGVGAKPYNSFFVPVNQFLYVQNRKDDTFSILRSDDSLVASISAGEQNIGGAFNPQNNCIYVSDTPNNRINVIGFSPANSGITISPDYSEIQADFKSNFAILQHVRFIVSGPERLHSFRLNRFNSTGTTSTKRLSFEQYASPTYGLNVSEFIALAGTLIDGRMNWKFMLPAFHTVSVLIWYRQFKVQDLLPGANTIKNYKNYKPKNK